MMLTTRTRVNTTMLSFKLINWLALFGDYTDYEVDISILIAYCYTNAWRLSFHEVTMLTLPKLMTTTVWVEINISQTPQTDISANIYA